MLKDTTDLKAKRGGFVLIEALTALSVLVIAMVGVISLLANSYKLNRTVADKYVATYLAAEGVEVAKNLMDANFIQGRPWGCGIPKAGGGSYELIYGDTLSNNCSHFIAAPSRETCSTGDYLYFNPNTNLYSYNHSSGNTATNFSRCVQITPKQSNPATSTYNEMIVSSTVNWFGGGQSYSVTLEDHFFDWRP